MPMCDICQSVRSNLAAPVSGIVWNFHHLEKVGPIYLSPITFKTVVTASNLRNNLSFHISWWRSFFLPKKRLWPQECTWRSMRNRFQSSDLLWSQFRLRKEIYAARIRASRSRAVKMKMTGLAITIAILITTINNRFDEFTQPKGRLCYHPSITHHPVLAKRGLLPW